MIKNNFLETIKSLDGEVYNLKYHQERYESVLNSLGCSDYKNLRDYLFPPLKGLYRCRLTYNENQINVSYHGYKKRDIKSLKIVYDDTIEYAKKSEDRNSLDELYAQRKSSDEILIVKNGLVTDTTIANIAFFKNGIWYTPTSPLLQGTTRQRYLDNAKLIEADIVVQDLKKYTKIALLNAMIDFDIITDISYEM